MEKGFNRIMQDWKANSYSCETIKINYIKVSEKLKLFKEKKSLIVMIFLLKSVGGSEENKIKRSVCNTGSHFVSFNFLKIKFWKCV
jgi:hypothetical protein